MSNEDILERIGSLKKENEELEERLVNLENRLDNLTELVEKKNLEIKELQNTILTVMVNENQENGLY